MAGRRNNKRRASQGVRAMAAAPSQQRQQAVPDAQTALALMPSPDAQAAVALRSLRTLAPTLHQHPDLLAEVRHTLRMAESRQIAIATGNAGSGIGIPALDGMFATYAASGNGPGSPTGSTPLSSSPSGYLGGWAGTKDQPKGVMNARVLRNFANDPWVFAAKKHRAEAIARADIDVLPLDPDKPFDKRLQQRVRRLLNCPNELRDSWTSLIKRVVDDILVLDRGCISKGMNARRQPLRLYSEDGATIKIYANWAGDPATPRYLYEEPGTTRTVPLRNDELICVMESEATYRFGYSRVQVLLDDIDADIQATTSAKELVKHKPPPTAIQIPGAGDTAIRQLRSDYEALIAGKREILFLGGDQPMQAKSLVFSLKDNQWMEYTTYLARKICAVFQVSPQSIGITFDVNRATADSQSDIEDDAGNIPLLLLIEEYLNRELLWDYAPPSREDGLPDFESLNLGIFFTEITEASRRMHIERILSTAEKGMAGAPFTTPNEIREMLGQEPMDGGNTLWVPTQTGMVPWLSYDGETGAFTPATVGGYQGAQEPGGGPDEDERDLDDTKQQKPQAQQQPRTGDESSGDGATPNVPTDDGGGGAGSGSGDGAATKAATPAGAVLPFPVRPTAPAAPTAAVTVRRDVRTPGRAWNPGKQIAANVAMQRARPSAAMALPAAYQQVPQPDALTEMMTAMFSAVLQLAANGNRPHSLGRVSEDVASAYRRPHREERARADLEAQARAIFERAAQRGRLQLTQAGHDRDQARFQQPTQDTAATPVSAGTGAGAGAGT